MSGNANTGKKVFYCFYKITSSKNYNVGKDKKNSFYWSKRIFLQHWFDNGNCQLTNQNFHFENLVVACLRRVYNFTSHNKVYILSYKHASRPIRERVAAAPNFFMFFTSLTMLHCRGQVLRCPFSGVVIGFSPTRSTHTNISISIHPNHRLGALGGMLYPVGGMSSQWERIESIW